jgi:hypothetical protein
MDCYQDAVLQVLQEHRLLVLQELLVQLVQRRLQLLHHVMP